MHFTSVRFSETDGGVYRGGEGRVPSTASRRQLRPISSEAGLTPQDTDRRERDLKTGKGYRDLRPRSAVWLTTVRGNKLERH
jgi:hypothetical protein